MARLTAGMFAAGVTGPTGAAGAGWAGTAAGAGAANGISAGAAKTGAGMGWPAGCSRGCFAARSAAARRQSRPINNEKKHSTDQTVGDHPHGRRPVSRSTRSART